jgi:hypothetical protein
MSYLDFNDGLNEVDQPSNIQTTSTVVSQQAKDLSDWRNIQLGATPTLFDQFWMPTTVNPWTPPNTPVYSSSQNPYPWTNSNNNPPWSIPTYPIGTTNPGLPIINFNSPQQNFIHPDTTNNVIDLTTNTTVNPSTPIRFEQNQSRI